jgi:toxin HigB-1
MIRSFRDKETERLFARQRVRKLALDLQRRAYRKLLVLDGAEDLWDLVAPPGNRLEKLKGDREGEYSIRINDQYRLCFRWIDGAPHDVEMTDYH